MEKSTSMRYYLKKNSLPNQIDRLFNGKYG